MEGFEKTLRALRKKKGLNQEELAQILGVRKTTISNYETGYSTPNTAMLRRIADFFGVSYEVIMGDMPSLNESSPSFNASTTLKQIPVYVSPPTDEISETDAIYYLSLPLSLIGNHKFFALKITGDRMDRTQLTDGSMAIIRCQDFADDGDIAVTSAGNNPAQINRFHRNGEHVILVAESNNSSYQSTVIDLREQAIKILGKVIMVLKPVS